MPHPRTTTYTEIDFQHALSHCARAYADDQLTNWQDSYLENLIEEHDLEDLNDLDFQELSTQQIEQVVTIGQLVDLPETQEL